MSLGFIVSVVIGSVFYGLLCMKRYAAFGVETVAVAILGCGITFSIYALISGNAHVPMLVLIIGTLLVCLVAIPVKDAVIKVRDAGTTAVKAAKEKMEAEKEAEIHAAKMAKQFQGDVQELVRKSLRFLLPENNPDQKDFLAIQVRKYGVYAALQPESYSEENFTLVTSFSNELSDEGVQNLINDLYRVIKGKVSDGTSVKPAVELVWDYKMITLWCEHFTEEDYLRLYSLF